MDKMTLKIAKAWVLGLFTCRETFLKTYGVKGSSHSTLCSLDFFYPPLFFYLPVNQMPASSLWQLF